MSTYKYHVIETNGAYFHSRGGAQSRDETEQLAIQGSKKKEKTWWIVANHLKPTRIMAAEGVFYVYKAGLPQDVKMSMFEVSRLFTAHEKKREDAKVQRRINFKGRKIAHKFVYLMIVAVIVVLGLMGSDSLF